MPAADDAFTLRVVHRLPGRARFRIRGIGGMGDRAVAARVEHRLSALSGIDEVRVNSLCGTILIRHSCAYVDVAAHVEECIAAHAPRGADGSGPVGATAPRGRRGAGVSGRAGTDPPDWPGLSVEQALERLAVSPGQGLGDDEAASRIGRFGANTIREAAVPGPLIYLNRQLFSAPIALLGAAAAVSVATGGIADAIGIGVAIALNSTIGATTEWQSEKTIRLLSRPTNDACDVRRGGRRKRIRIADIVPGDVLPLSPGDVVPADARLLSLEGLTVDESALTGESMPEGKDAAAVCDAGTPLAEQRNMVFRGTVVTGGSATAVAVLTGAATQVGRIQASAESAQPPETPMQVQLGQLGRQLSWLSIGACVAVLGVGLLRGGRLTDMIKAAVSLGVAAVPEGLPAVATSTLAIGVRNMRRRGLLVRNINAVETIGAVDVVCLDKTGTLTENRIAPAAAFVALERFTIDRQRIYGDVSRPSESPELRKLLELIAISNDAVLHRAGDGAAREGSATETALLEMAQAGGIDVERSRARHLRLATSYRSEDQPYMTTLHRSGSRGRLMVVKGNPRVVLGLCTDMRGKGRKRRLDDALRATILAENERWSSDSLRVLGVACDHFGEHEERRPDRLTWLGLVGLRDPLRHGMRELIADLHLAGIATAMITGDQMGTAAAIGRELALSGDEPLRVLDSRDLARLDPDVFDAIAGQTDVFARVSPANKLEIVQALQRAGRVVAMTGDGINDGPALKVADVGIAMGQARNDVARSVADIVVDDDRLESVIAALAQGRAIYTNVRKAIHYLISTNMSEIEVMLGSSLLGLGMPLTPMQLLWINLATDALPGIALGLDPPSREALRQPPRDRTEPVIAGGKLRRMLVESGVISVAALGSLLVGRARYGGSERPGTMAFNTLILAQLLHAFACRSNRPLLRQGMPQNRALTGAILGSVVIQASALALPPLRRFLGAARLGPFDIIVSSGAALLAVFVNDLLKHAAAAGARSGEDPIERRSAPVAGRQK